MKYIPEEHVLIDYLYGTLKGDEKEKVEQYLEENPAVRNELLGMQQARETLGKYGDREVIVPEQLEEKSVASSYHVPYLKTIVSVAAAVILVLLIGFITNLKMTYKDQQLTLQFGEVAQPTESKLTEAEIKNLIVETLQANNPQTQSFDEDSLKVELAEWFASADEQRNKAFEKKLRQLVSQEKKLIGDYSQDMQEKNTKIIDQYFQTAALNQRSYVEDVLVDFTKYMDEQRLQDRQFYINNLVDFKYQSDIQRQETEQILTSIMNKVSNIPNEGETQNF